jgi:uncharacterized repeat protein (TIGR01451 family)
VLLATHVAAQTPAPSREYIYLGNRVVAIENSSSSSGNGSQIAIWPSTASLAPGQSQQFNAVVEGSSASVTWTTNPSIGTISPSGLYTAPATLGAVQSVTVTASLTGANVTAAANIALYSSTSSGGSYPLLGSFLMFDRNLSAAQWNIELQSMASLGMNTLVILSVGSLQPNSGDPTGYSLSGVGLLYPSSFVDPSVRPTTDYLESILSMADQKNMRVYLGSLQTYEDWSTGLEFSALQKYNPIVAQEILTNYKQHPSLAGWYFSQEIWLNWVKYYGASYYGVNLLQQYVSAMRGLDPTKPVCAAIVFKETGYGAMPGLSTSEIPSWTTALLQNTGLQILMPQDGAGAEAGAPTVAELPGYFQAFQAGVAAAGTSTVLWSTIETFTSEPNLSNDQYPPADAGRIQQQINNERPYVTGYVSWLFGHDMSPQATYYPVEAGALSRNYQSTFQPSLSQSVAVWYANEQASPVASSSYPDLYSIGGSAFFKLRDHTGGGYNDSSHTTWAGWWSNDSAGVINVNIDLGYAQPVSKVRALSLSQGSWGIYHPFNMAVQISSDGITYSAVGTASTPWPNTTDYSVGWTELSMNATGRYIRCILSQAPSEWLFLAELEVVGPPQAGVSVSVDPQSVTLLEGQAQSFAAIVAGASNTAITWSLSPAIGSLNNGLYTAPAPGTINGPTTVSVTAVSVEDSSKSATALANLVPNAPLKLGPINPSGGTGISQTFQFAAQPSSGASILSVELLINGSLSPANGCYVYYDSVANLLSLGDDTGAGWIGNAQPGGSGTLQNSQCMLNLAGSTISQAGTSMSVNLSITFSGNWTGTKQLYLFGNDTANNEIDGQWVGYWTVQAGTPSAALSVAKTHSGSFSQGQQGNFTIVISNNSGAAPTSGTVTVVDTPSSGLALISMSGTGWACSANTCARSDVLAAKSSYPPITAGVSVGVGATSPQSNQATVSGGGSQAANASDTVTVGQVGQPPQAQASWSSGAYGGTAVSKYTFAFYDPLGPSNIQWVAMLMNSTFSASNGCIAYFYADGHSYMLGDDGLSAATGYWGQSGVLQNSQCDVDLSGARLYGANGYLYLDAPVLVKTAFNRNQNIWLSVGNNQGLTQTPTWLQAAFNLSMTSSYNFQVFWTNPVNISSQQQSFTVTAGDYLGTSSIQGMSLTAAQNPNGSGATWCSVNSLVSPGSPTYWYVYTVPSPGAPWSIASGYSGSGALSTGYCSLDLSTAQVLVDSTYSFLQVHLTALSPLYGLTTYLFGGLSYTANGVSTSTGGYEGSWVIQ